MFIEKKRRRPGCGLMTGFAGGFVVAVVFLGCSASFARRGQKSDEARRIEQISRLITAAQKDKEGKDRSNVKFRDLQNGDKLNGAPLNRSGSVDTEELTKRVAPDMFAAQEKARREAAERWGTKYP